MMLHIEERRSTRSLKIQSSKVVLQRDEKVPVTKIVHQIIIWSVVLCFAILGRQTLLQWPPSGCTRSTAGLLQTAHSDVLLVMSVMTHMCALLLSRSVFNNRIHRYPGSLIHPSNCKDTMANHNRKDESLYFRLPTTAH